MDLLDSRFRACEEIQDLRIIPDRLTVIIAPLFVIPAKAGIRNFPTELGLRSVCHGPSGFPPSRE